MFHLNQCWPSSSLRTKLGESHGLGPTLKLDSTNIYKARLISKPNLMSFRGYFCRGIGHKLR